MSMSKYISSVSITFAPKDNYSMEPMVTTVLSLDLVVGSTVLQATNYIGKNPLVRQYLNKYHIVNLLFQYSEL